MREKVTLDQIAAEYLLDGKDVAPLLKVGEILTAGRCPFCESNDLDDNGSTDHESLIARCNSCGEEWNPAEEAIDALEAELQA